MTSLPRHALAWIALAVAACGAPTPTAEPQATASFDPTGILLVGLDEAIQGGPLPRRLANQFSDALELANDNGDDLGYPWVDPETAELVLSVVTPRGRQLAAAAGFTVPHRIREVTHGVATLARLQDDVGMLRPSGVPGTEHIYAAMPDYRDNRALILVDELEPELLVYLAEHYPADALAIQVDPEGGPAIGN